MKVKLVIKNLIIISLLSVSSYGYMFLGSDETAVMPASNVEENVVVENAGDTISYQGLLAKLQDKDPNVRVEAIQNIETILPQIENYQIRTELAFGVLALVNNPVQMVRNEVIGGTE